jgi:hypothetical protein
MTHQTQAPAAGRVTIDDVRTVLDGTDPNQTNASKVRTLLGGRGSFETIQKHLNTLRQELATAAAPPVAPDQVPALPADAAQAMWVAAWNAAQVATLRRTEKLVNERDAALLKLEIMGQDVAGLVATIDDQSGQLEQAKADALAVDAAHLADVDKFVIDHEAAEAERVNLAKNLERTLQELAQEKSSAAHAAELAESGRVMMREELQRLTDQVGELKAHLYKRAETAPLP